MSVHSRTLPSGKTTFEVRWREGNRNRSSSFATKKAANEFDREMTRLRQAGDLAAELERRRVTVEDLVGDWIERRAPSLTPRTRAHYAHLIQSRILPAFGSRRVKLLAVADIERWVTDMRNHGVGDPTIRKACAVLQALLTMAVRDGILSANVVQQAGNKPAQGRSRVPYLIAPESVELVRADFARRGRERDVVLLDLLAYAGLRPESEAVTLQWRSVRDRSLIVRDTKRGRERTVPMLAPLSESLAVWRLRRGRPDADALVVPANSGNPWTIADWRRWRDRHFRPAAIRAGLPADVRPRDLRGSFVSLLIHEGRNIVEVARQVGHSPEICLRDYAQIVEDFDPANRRSATETIRAARAAAAAALNNDDQATA